MAAIVHIFAFFGACLAMSSWTWTKASLEARGFFRRYVLQSILPKILGFLYPPLKASVSLAMMVNERLISEGSLTLYNKTFCHLRKSNFVIVLHASM